MRSLLLLTTFLMSASALAICEPGGKGTEIGPIQQVYACETLVSSSDTVRDAKGCLYVSQEGMALEGQIVLKDIYGPLPFNEGVNANWPWDRVKMGQDVYFGKRRREGTLTNPPQGIDLRFAVKDQLISFVRYERGLFTWKPHQMFQLRCDRLN